MTLSSWNTSLVQSPNFSNVERGQYLDEWLLRNIMFWKLGCVGGVMNNSLEWEMGDLSSNSSRVGYIHVSANNIGKHMNPPLVPQVWVK